MDWDAPRRARSDIEYSARPRHLARHRGLETSGGPCESVSLSAENARQIIPPATADIRQCHPTRKEEARPQRVEKGPGAQDRLKDPRQLGKKSFVN